MVDTHLAKNLIWGVGANFVKNKFQKICYQKKKKKKRKNIRGSDEMCGVSSYHIRILKK